MERLITVKDVSERYGCSLPTARKYIRQCNPHMENPLTVTAAVFREWENGRTVTEPTRKTRKTSFTEGRVIVPRRRD